MLMYYITIITKIFDVNTGNLGNEIGLAKLTVVHDWVNKGLGMSSHVSVRLSL